VSLFFDDLSLLASPLSGCQSGNVSMISISLSFVRAKKTHKKRNVRLHERLKYWTSPRVVLSRV
jgi:hypothetical protein